MVFAMSNIYDDGYGCIGGERDDCCRDSSIVDETIIVVVKWWRWDGGGAKECWCKVDVIVVVNGCARWFWWLSYKSVVQEKYHLLVSFRDQDAAATSALARLSLSMQGDGMERCFLVKGAPEWTLNLPYQKYQH